MNVSVLNFGNTPVSFRQDGFLNATAIASHFGKLPKDYLKSEQTQQYISALAENLSVRRKILTEANQIVIVKRGGSEQGTWLHPKLAIHFARWLNPKFAVWCDEQIEILLNGKISDGIKTVTPQTHPRPSGRLDRRTNRSRQKTAQRPDQIRTQRSAGAYRHYPLVCRQKQVRMQLQRSTCRTVPRSFKRDGPRGS